jgi:hypothetical protein
MCCLYLGYNLRRSRSTTGTSSSKRAWDDMKRIQVLSIGLGSGGPRDADNPGCYPPLDRLLSCGAISTVMARKRKSRALANGHAPVSAMALARHFGVAHQYIHALVAQAVIERRPDGKFDETTCRLRYIAHLRAQNKRSPLAAADAEHSAAKAALIRIRIAQAKRELVKRADVNDLIDRMCGVMLTAFGSLPAMCAAPNDLMTRR